MKKFKFRLERVLSYRQMVKRDKLRELMLRHHKLSEDEAHLTQLREEQLRTRLNEDRVMSADELLLIGAYENRLRDEISRQIETVAESQRAVDAAMAEYIEASKDAEALEKLKQKKHEQYAEELSKYEEKMMDELTVQKGNTLQDKDDQRN